MAPTQYIDTFSEKPHEIKEILVRVWGGALNPPLIDASMFADKVGEGGVDVGDSPWKITTPPNKNHHHWFRNIETVSPKSLHSLLRNVVVLLVTESDYVNCNY